LFACRLCYQALTVFYQLVTPQLLGVDFADEITDGLVLCPSDVDPNNFIINDKGEVVAIDFGRTGYMPASFVAYSLKCHKDFTQKVVRFVEYPKPAKLIANLLAMETASGMLVVSGNNALGE
jgi:hypothetical protein